MILGASFDTVEDNRAFVDKHRFPFALLCDVDHRLAVAYGAAAGPDAAYPNRITVVVGADGNVLRVYDDVAPKEHPARVLADLAAG